VTIQSLKEDLQRKTKLYQACKEAKSADNNAIETWKHEVHQLEETIKRLQRNLSSKDNMIKDLKNKCDSLEDVAAVAEKGVIQEVQQAFGTSSSGFGTTSQADLYSMSAPEMRAK
jgi:predicted RNase H-like nuclease (RuvC/YqgF family)